MKNNKIRIMAAAAGILLLAGCSNDGGMGTVIDAGIITIDATIGQMTKVSYSGSSTSFTENDTILLYGWTGSSTEVPQERVVDSVACSFDGTSWTTAKPMFWKNATDAHYFLGIYPVPDSLPSFTAAPYKLDPADYTASDLLIATNLSGVKATAGQVMLNFDHVMACLNVNIRFRSEFEVTPTVSSVTATALDSATVNYLTKEVTAVGTSVPVEIPAAASVATGYDLSYSGLQVPQDGVTTISVAIAGNKYVYTSKDIPLESGRYTTLGLIIGKDSIELASVNVNDWVTAPDLSGGEAKLYDPYNGHEYVDMGLSVKWATCNVGSTNTVDYGDFFAWGETETYYESVNPLSWYVITWRVGMSDGYTFNNYKWCNGSGTSLTKYNNNSDYGIVDNKITLELEDDAAHVKWGGSWRMPTKAEWDELMNDNNCTWAYTKGYCNYGYLVTSKINGNSIFLPIVGRYKDISWDFKGDIGFYWSSSLYADEPSNAWFAYLKWYDEIEFEIKTKNNSRNHGFSVRPVCP